MVPVRTILTGVLAVLWSAATGAQQTRCSEWELVNPRPQANHLRDVAFGGGRWVAVGEGTAVVSTDAQAWRAAPLPGRSLRSAAYGNGVFVAVGVGGVIVRSADGVTWEAAAPATSVDLEAVAFAGGTFLSVGADATVLGSTDGLTWTQEWPDAVQGDLAGVRVSGWVAGNKGPMFLVWGPSSIALRRLDGTWLPIPLPDGAVVSQTPFWVNSAICATIECPAGWCDVEQCGPSDFYVTHDGAVWEGLCYGLERGPLDVVAKGKGLVGFQRYPGSHTTTLWTTPDGWSWFEQPSMFNVPMQAIEAAGGLFVAVGDHGAIWTSPDGTTWASASGPTIDLDRVGWNGAAFAASGSLYFNDANTSIAGNEIQNAVVAGNGLQWEPSVVPDLTLAAAAPGLFVASIWSRVYSSVDGHEWNERDTLPGGPLRATVWDGRRFAGLAGGGVSPCSFECDPEPAFAVVSEDPSDWQYMEQPELFAQFVRLVGMAFNGQRYVALADRPLYHFGGAPVFASEDGLSWRRVGEVSSVTSGSQAVASDGKGFVAARGNSVLTSADGLAWSSADIAPLHLIGVMWTGEEYVGVGDDGAGHAAVARSPDGVAWTHEAFPAIPGRLLAVAGGRRVQLAVGVAGLTLRRECHPLSPSRRLRGPR